jgi:hypothetical protein
MAWRQSLERSAKFLCLHCLQILLPL